MTSTSLCIFVKTNGYKNGECDVKNDSTNDDSSNKNNEEGGTWVEITVLHAAVSFGAPLTLVKLLLNINTCDYKKEGNRATFNTDAINVCKVGTVRVETINDDIFPDVSEVDGYWVTTADNCRQNQSRQRQRRRHFRHRQGFRHYPSHFTNRIMKLCGKKGTCNSESNNNNTIHQFFAENSNNDVYNIDTDGENIINDELHSLYSLNEKNNTTKVDPQSFYCHSLCGLLPIHLAMHFRSDPAVVEELLCVYPSSSKTKCGGGYLPIHIACGAAATIPFSSSAISVNESTSIFDNHWDIVKVIRLLLRAFPDSVHVPSSCLLPSYTVLSNSYPLETLISRRQASSSSTDTGTASTSASCNNISNCNSNNHSDNHTHTNNINRNNNISYNVSDTDYGNYTPEQYASMHLQNLYGNETYNAVKEILHKSIQPSPGPSDLANNYIFSTASSRIMALVEASKSSDRSSTDRSSSRYNLFRGPSSSLFSYNVEDEVNDDNNGSNGDNNGRDGVNKPTPPHFTNHYQSSSRKKSHNDDNKKDTCGGKRETCNDNVISVLEFSTMSFSFIRRLTKSGYNCGNINESKMMCVI